jgi:hypothetical protein
MDVPRSIFDYPAQMDQLHAAAVSSARLLRRSVSRQSISIRLSWPYMKLAQTSFNTLTPTKATARFRFWFRRSEAGES